MENTFLSKNVFLLLSLALGFYSLKVSVKSPLVEDGAIQIIGEFPDPDLELNTSNILKTVASNKYIYLLEHSKGFIYQFDYDGNYVSTISESGLGIGELTNPLDLVYWNQKLYTFEQGKMQVQIFNEEGDYEGKYVLNGAYDQLLVFENKLLLKNYYYHNMPEFLDMPSQEDYPIYTEYFPEQDSVAAFGNYPDFFDRLGISTKGIMSSVYDDKVYIGYNSFPLIQVYDKNGTIIKEIHLEGNGFEKIIPRYLEELPDTYLSIFMDMEVNERGIFLSAYGTDEKMIFYHFDLNGQLISTYSLAEYYESEFRDLYIRNFEIIPNFRGDISRLFLTIQGEKPRTLIAEINL